MSICSVENRCGTAAAAVRILLVIRDSLFPPPLFQSSLDPLCPTFVDSQSSVSWLQHIFCVPRQSPIKLRDVNPLTYKVLREFGVEWGNPHPIKINRVTLKHEKKSDVYTHWVVRRCGPRRRRGWVGGCRRCHGPRLLLLLIEILNGWRVGCRLMMSAVVGWSAASFSRRAACRFRLARRAWHVTALSQSVYYNYDIIIIISETIYIVMSPELRASFEYRRWCISHQSLKNVMILK